MNIQLTVTVEEANAILAALGQLPTSSGVFPLLAKIKSQGESQLPPPAETSADEAPAAEASTEV